MPRPAQPLLRMQTRDGIRRRSFTTLVVVPVVHRVARNSEPRARDLVGGYHFDRLKHTLVCPVGTCPDSPANLGSSRRRLSVSATATSASAASTNRVVKNPTRPNLPTNWPGKFSPLMSQRNHPTTHPLRPNVSPTLHRTTCRLPDPSISRTIHVP